MTRQAEWELCWLSVEQAARLAASSSATVRGWVRRGAVRARNDEAGTTWVHLEDVVARALERHARVDPAAREGQVSAALDELETTLRELTKAASELDELRSEVETLRRRSEGLEEKYARRAQWARGQHERELREAYNLWEQERSQWEEERARLGAPALSAPPDEAAAGEAPADEVAESTVATNGQVTSRPPISDAILPPLHGAAPPSRPAAADITPNGRSRAWRRHRS